MEKHKDCRIINKMKTVTRPLAIIGYTFFIASNLAKSMPKEYLYILLAFFACLIMFHYFTKRKYTKHLMLSLLIFVLSVFYTELYTSKYQESISKIPTDTKTYTGYVEKINNLDKTSYNIKLVDTNNGNREIFGIKIFHSGGLSVGDKIKLTGKFTAFRQDAFTANNYLNDIKGNLAVSQVEKSSDKINSLSYEFLLLKQYLLSKADILYTQKSEEIVHSMGYSDKSYLPQETKNLFISGGISHALVVSGFHIMIMLVSIRVLVNMLKIRKKIKNVIIILLLFVFMALIGFTPSIIRAGFVAMISLVLANFKKEIDGLTTIALLMLITVITNPYAANDIGVMLSYSACTGLILSNNLKKVYKEKNFLQYCKKSLITTSMAVLFTMPILSLSGMDLTIISPIYNLLFLPLISIICTLSFFTPIISCLGLLGEIINFVLVNLNKTLIDMLFFALSIIQKYFNFALINLSDEIFIIMFISAITAYAVALLQIDNKKLRHIFVLAISLVAFLCYNFINLNVVTVTIFDSGREASFVIKSGQNNSLILSEKITSEKLRGRLAKTNSSNFDSIYICAKDTGGFENIDEILDAAVNLDDSVVINDKAFILESRISSKEKRYILTIADTKLAFGHGKVVAENAEKIDIYILGNDKPINISAENIFIFGNTPKYIKISDITELSYDLKVKINTKTGKYKILKDVYNFGN